MSEKAPQLDGYRLDSELGRGTWGVVYRAVQVELNRPVAVKMLGQGLLGSVEGRARFVREGRIQGRLSHPNLVPVLDSGFSGETPYLVMALMEGGALRERLVPRRPLEFPEVARIGAALAAGLAHAHRHNVIHRDLKPENVLFSREGEPKIGDFGLAKALDASNALRTADGRIFGTVAYLAPEVIQGEPATAAADTYAPGVMLLEMSGVGSLVRGRDTAVLLQAHLNGTIASLVRLRGDIPAEIQQVMTQCLERDPEMRPASLEAVQAKLALVAGSGEANVSLTSDSWTADTPKSEKSRQLQGNGTSAWKTPKKSTQQPAAAQGRRAGSKLALLAASALVVLAGPEVERMRERNPATIRANLTALEEAVAALSQSQGDRLIKDWRGLGCLVELLGRRARLRELLGKPVLPLEGQKAPAIRDGYEELLPFAGPLAELAREEKKDRELAEPMAWVFAAAARTLTRPTAGAPERERALEAAKLVRPLLRPDLLSPSGRADLARNQKLLGP
ncbi:MAG: serine/threonine protein kinase [Candidatus Wallbacteria bacterium]|nr:serine/threonine protein kinase [Candidatus Wallbacteria bacterium]